MKLTRNAIRTASAVLLTMLLTAAAPSCESESDRKDEVLREELRNAIGVIERNQQDHLAVQREFVELHEKLNLKAFALGQPPPAVTERKKLERSEHEYASGWQDEIRGKIDNASGDELQRVLMELRLIGEKADMEKTFTASALNRLKRHQETPPSERLF